MAEETVWQGTSSHTLNLGKHVLCWLFCWLIVPIVISFYLFLRVRTTVYILTNERFRVTRGILNKRTDDLELYRVKDLTLIKPFSQRLVKAGTIEMTTSDHTTPLVVLPAIKEPAKVLDLIRSNVEKQRDRKRVTEVDMT
jgi:uncharacterized membrane protein YdbT with pleckstrin-like domain